MSPAVPTSNGPARRVLHPDEIVSDDCSHLDMLREVTPSAMGCEDCMKSSGVWVHLRICLTCGHVGCCDESPNQHATKHYHASHHPLVQSFEPGQEWVWCYEDQILVKR